MLGGCLNVTRVTHTIMVLVSLETVVFFPIESSYYLDAHCNLYVISTRTGCVIVTNNCGSTTPSYRDSTTSVGGCNPGYELSRMWEVLDDCGNVTRDTQTIMVLDTVAPIVVFSIDTTLYLDANCFVSVDSRLTRS